MRRVTVLFGVVATAGLIAACGGGAAASNVPTLPAVNVPSLAIPSISVPSIAIPSISIPSISIPSLPVGSAGGFNNHADPALEARYPQTIGGNPVTDVASYRLSDFVGLMAANDQAKASAFLGALVGAGLDPTTISFGTGGATVKNADGDDDDVSLDSVHTPGADANKFVALWPQLALLDQTDEALPTISTATVGGKNVTVMTESDGTITYIYPQSDVVWSLQPSDATEAATVLQALP